MCPCSLLQNLILGGAALQRCGKGILLIEGFSPLRFRFGLFQHSV